MKSRLFLSLLLTLVTLSFTSGSYAETTINIDVAPNTLNIQSQGTIVTVHTDIAYSAVVGATVTLNNDIAISWWKADNQGNFVAKFEMDEVKFPFVNGDLEPGINELTLEGTTKDGDSFSGSQEITIINIEPQGK